MEAQSYAAENFHSLAKEYDSILFGNYCLLLGVSTVWFREWNSPELLHTIGDLKINAPELL